MGNTIRSTVSSYQTPSSSSSSTLSSKEANMDAETLVRQAIANNPVVIFSKTYCPYCHSAKSDISKASKSVADAATPKIYELDNMGELGMQVQSHLAQFTGRRTVPNVFIGGSPVGGGDEIRSLASSGILKQMIAQAGTKLKENEKEKEKEKENDENIDDIIKKYAVVMYSKTYCGFCDQAKTVLNQHTQQYDSNKIKIYELDRMGKKGQTLQQLLRQKTNQSTVPNIFINGKHIGGCDDLMATLSSLPSLLEAAFNSSSSSSDSTAAVEKEESAKNVKEIIFGAGCFWGVELAFQRIEGVISTQVGYSNGKMEGITYDAICTGMTGAAEVVKVEYDEDIISLKQLLNLWHSRHDVTSLNKQGNDEGTQYRSAVFYTDEENQKPIIDEFFKELESKVDGEIVSDIGKVDKYTAAEDYHQQYLEKRGQSAEKGATTRIRCYG